MKRSIVLTSLLLISLLSIAQDKNSFNFFVQDGDVVWQRVFQTELNKDDVFTALKTSGNITDITETDSVIAGSLVERKMDYASLGYSRGDVPIFVNHLLGGFVKVEMREGRYRVTINKLYRLDDTSRIPERTDFTFYVNKNGLFRFFPDKAQEIFDYNFTRMFEIKKKLEDDW